jgi:predicted DNA-binding helix-hairpin-helix protein
VNLEAPTPASLATIAPDKDFKHDLLLRMKWVADAVRDRVGAVSHTTQFVVGASQESDLDILKTVDWIYRELAVFRAYFSAYQPVGDGGRGSGEPDALLREHRLYQVDFLLRGYGFRFGDIVFDRSGNVPLEVDPKTAYAMMHPELYPVDANGAAEADLLKVPGIGPVAARRILERRRAGVLRDFDDLCRVGGIRRKAAAFLMFAGRPGEAQRDAWRQLELLEDPGQGWRTALEPLDKERILPAPSGAAYEYPGQTGRRLYHAGGSGQAVVRCR